MKPSELYAREPEKIINLIEPDCDYSYISGCYYNHIPEIADDRFRPSTRIKVRIYKDFNFDGRRFWRIASIWIDDIAVMIVRNAGREGDDFYDRFITNQEAYGEMVSHLSELRIPDEHDLKELVDKDADIPNLTDFYGNDLDGHFERYHF